MNPAEARKQIEALTELFDETGHGPLIFKSNVLAILGEIPDPPKIFLREDDGIYHSGDEREGQRRVERRRNYDVGVVPSIYDRRSGKDRRHE